MGWKAAMLVVVASTGVPKVPPMPVGFVDTNMFVGPTLVFSGCWKETSTWPEGPIEILPKFALAELGIERGALNALTAPSPVTLAPAAKTLFVLAPLAHSTQTLPAPTATAG